MQFTNTVTRRISHAEYIGRNGPYIVTSEILTACEKRPVPGQKWIVTQMIFNMF